MKSIYDSLEKLTESPYFKGVKPKRKPVTWTPQSTYKKDFVRWTKLFTSTREKPSMRPPYATHCPFDSFVSIYQKDFTPKLCFEKEVDIDDEIIEENASPTQTAGLALAEIGGDTLNAEQLTMNEKPEEKTQDVEISEKQIKEISDDREMQKETDDQKPDVKDITETEKDENKEKDVEPESNEIVKEDISFENKEPDANKQINDDTNEQSDANKQTNEEINEETDVNKQTNEDTKVQPDPDEQTNEPKSQPHTNVQTKEPKTPELQKSKILRPNTIDSIRSLKNANDSPFIKPTKNIMEGIINTSRSIRSISSISSRRSRSSMSSYRSSCSMDSYLSELRPVHKERPKTAAIYESKISTRKIEEKRKQEAKEEESKKSAWEKFAEREMSKHSTPKKKDLLEEEWDTESVKSSKHRLFHRRTNELVDKEVALEKKLECEKNE